MYVSAVSVDIL